MRRFNPTHSPVKWKVLGAGKHPKKGQILVVRQAVATRLRCNAVGVRFAFSAPASAFAPSPPIPFPVADPPHECHSGQAGAKHGPWLKNKPEEDFVRW